MRSVFVLLVAAIAADANPPTGPAPVGDGRRLIDVQTIPGTPGRRQIIETPGTPGRRITTYEERLPPPPTIEERFIEEPAPAAQLPAYREPRERIVYLQSPEPRYAPRLDITVRQRPGLLACLLGPRTVVRIRQR